MTPGERMFFAIRISAALDVGLSTEDALWRAASDLDNMRALALIESIGEPAKTMLRDMLGEGEVPVTPCPWLDPTGTGHCLHPEPEFGNCAMPSFPEQCPIGPLGPICHGTGQPEEVAPVPAVTCNAGKPWYRNPDPPHWPTCPACGEQSLSTTGQPCKCGHPRGKPYHGTGKPGAAL
jgi:hypothetical protein